MGLSSSQARLLSLTGRMHDIEYKAQKLEAQKLQLANETRRVNENYLNALEAIKVQKKILNTDGSTTFVDATFKNFVYSQAGNNSIYILRNTETGKVYVPNEIRSAFANSDRTLDGFMKTLSSLRTDKSSYTSITSASQLMSLKNSTGNFKLDADIVLDNWSERINFAGILDGNGHTITINSGSEGLLYYANGATLRNLEVNVNITNYDRNNLGGLAAFINNTTIENCSVTGNLNGNRWLGGMVGGTQGTSTITNSTAAVNVSSDLVSVENGVGGGKFDAQSYAGGLVGCNQSGTLTIDHCRAEGDVSSEYEIIGGLMGMSRGTTKISNSVSTGNVTANRNGLGNNDIYDYTAMFGTNKLLASGTFFGEFSDEASVTIENCYAYGSAVTPENAQANYSDFGQNVSGNPPTIINSYSTFANTLTYSPKSVEGVSDLAAGGYLNIDSSEYSNLVELFNVLLEAGGGISMEEEYENDPEWFSNVLTYGVAMIATVDTKHGFEITDSSVAVSTDLREVANEKELRKAEVKHESDLKRIDMKDRKYDYDLAALENERNALKQEMETLKTVSKDNVERTFKLFS